MLCSYRENRQVCTRVTDHEGAHVLAVDTGSGAERFLALASQFPIDSDLLTRIEEHDGGPLPLGHHFLGVAGHPDDDECTYRSDGTDETYCGSSEQYHYWKVTV